GGQRFDDRARQLIVHERTERLEPPGQRNGLRRQPRFEEGELVSMPLVRVAQRPAVVRLRAEDSDLHGSGGWSDPGVGTSRAIIFERERAERKGIGGSRG